ncbi:LysR family transcriptional regulator [Palleronia sp.]|uniref:LysR family transcriptional regulator n=1 Tax=Palleronia sp. TaxID=1940284 RepID=UPI0035C7DAB6
MNWDDLRLFAAVSRCGALRDAAVETGLSPTTLSRRLRALEDRIGEALFLHGADGYALTPAGQTLARRTARMEREATGIGRPANARVRITAGTWTMIDLADHLTDFWRPGLGWTPDFVQCDRVLDIGRREVEIGICNAVPDCPWLAGRRVGFVDYAIYAAAPEVTGWIGPAEGSFVTRSQRWMLDRHGADVTARANSGPVAAAMAEAGLGRIVLPVFAAKRRAGLIRVGEPIPELRSEEWLVAHHEGRSVPAVRRALAGLARYLRTHPKG